MSPIFMVAMYPLQFISPLNVDWFFFFFYFDRDLQLLQVKKPARSAYASGDLEEMYDLTVVQAK